MNNLHFLIAKRCGSESDALYSYCGNCLSDNILKNDKDCFILDENKKCKCLDCGWMGTKRDTINITPKEREKIIKI